MKKVPDAIAVRTPPGQHLTTAFPVLTYGPTPLIAPRDWKLAILGLAENVEFGWDDLMAMPQTKQVCDIHCVTTWSKLDTAWTGVCFTELLRRIRVRPEAKYVMQHSYGGYTTNLPLEALSGDDVLLVHTFDGKPLEPKHGGPVRMLVPMLYFWKSAKWLRGLEFMIADAPGFWERNGYSNTADPWKQERYS